MKIAMFLTSERFSALDESIIQAIAFEVKNGFITGIDDELLSKRNVNYIILWLLNKNIKEIYLESIDEKGRAFLNKLGITIKTYEDMKDNDLLKSFLL